MTPVNIASVIAAVVYLLTVAVFLKRRGFRDRTAYLFVPYAALFCLWELVRLALELDWLAVPDGAASRVSLYVIFVLAVWYLQLTRIFLGYERPGWLWRLLGLAGLIGLAIVEIYLPRLPETLPIAGRWTLARWRLPVSIALLGWGLFMGGATLMIIVARRRVQQPLHKNRMIYWFLTLTLSALGTALLLAQRPFLSITFYLLHVLSVTGVLLTHRLLDVRHAARQFVGYLITALATIALYTGGFLLAQYVLQIAPTYHLVTVGVGLSLILALLFNPLLRIIRRFVNGLLVGARYDHNQALREYSQQINNVVELEALASTVVNFAQDALDARHGALFVVHPDLAESDSEERDGKAAGATYRLRGVSGGESEGGETPSGVLSGSSTLVDCLKREQVCLTQYDVDLHPRFGALAADERAWLKQLDMDIYIPIHAQGEWVGLLTLGPKRSGDRYFEPDMVLLATLADQTAVALDNARLFDDLKARNEEIKRLNEALARANQELTRMGRAKSDFIDIASHELRTPLTQVKGYTGIIKEMVETNSLDPLAAENMVRGLNIASQRLEEIVDMMFDVAQIDTETLSLNLSLKPIQPIIEAAAEQWRSALEERDLALTIAGLDHLPPISSDVQRLEQAFSQLIQNAIKFTPDGGHIQITGRLQAWTLPRDQRVEIIVADTGIGIAPEDLESIFEKFYRPGDVLLHSTGKTKFKGAGPGLGLTIVRGIVEAHGGRIWAESPGYDEEKRPGGEFHVVLPVHQVEVKRG